MERIAHKDQGRGDDTHVKAVKNTSQSSNERDPPDEGLIHVRLAIEWFVQYVSPMPNDNL
jgi:hypothetical protein